MRTFNNVMKDMRIEQQDALATFFADVANDRAQLKAFKKNWNINGLSEIFGFGFAADGMGRKRDRELYDDDSEDDSEDDESDSEDDSEDDESDSDDDSEDDSENDSEDDESDSEDDESDSEDDEYD